MKRLLPHLGWIIMALAMLLTVVVLFRPGFFAPHDFTHAARIAEMARGVRAGEFPVRWSSNFGFGYGMPLFTFYAPLPYYIGALLSLMGLSAIGSIKALMIIETIIAGIGMFLVARSWWGKWGGILSSVVFVLSTYRALDLYVRGALGEAFALSFIPFALYGATLLWKRKQSGMLWLAFGIAATLLSHNLTGLALCVFLVPVLSVFLVQAYRAKYARLFCIQASIGIVLGVGLSAFYTVPAFLEKSYTRVSEAITTGYFDYHNHFLCNKQLVVGTWKYGASLPGCSDDMSFAVGMIPLVVALCGALLIVKRGKSQDRVSVVVAGGMTLLAAFLCIGRSVWIWEHVPVLSYFQFPWRLLVFVHVGLALLCGASTRLSKKGSVLLTCVVAVLLMATSRSYFSPQTWLSGEQLQQYYQDSPSFIRTEMSKTLNDYLPAGISDATLPAPVSSRLESTGNVLMIEDRPSSLHARVDCAQDCTVAVHIFSYPGWEAVVDGKIVPMQPTPEKTYTVALQSGTHDLRLRLVPTTTQQLSLVLSGLSLGGVLWIIVRNFKTKQVY